MTSGSRSSSRITAGSGFAARSWRSVGGSHKITGPGVTLTEVTPTTYVVAFKHHAKWHEQELSPKRLRAVKETV